MLWALNVEYTELLEMTVGEPRDLLGVPRGGLATQPRHRHTHAPPTLLLED